MDFVRPVWDNFWKRTVYFVCVKDWKRIIGVKFRQAWYWLSFLSLKVMRYYNRLDREVVKPREIFFFKMILHKRHIPSIFSWKNFPFPPPLGSRLSMYSFSHLSFLLTWVMLVFMKKVGDKILYALCIVTPVTTWRPLFAHFNQT